MSIRIHRIAALLVLAAALPAGAAGTNTPNLDQREVNQQRRIDQGASSGALTDHEAARLQHRETKLNNDEAAAKADGNVTPAERRKLQREANRDSHAVFRKKHNLRTEN